MRTDTTSIRVLIVDDENSMRIVLRAELLPLGFVVDTAASGAEGLERLVEGTYSLLLLDLKMSEMDGLEVLRRVRKANISLPVILLTAHANVEVAVEAMKLGATEFLEKPLAPEGLRKVVKQVLDRQKIDESQPLTYTTAFELAKKRIGEQQLSAAEEFARSAMSLDPERPEAINLLGALFEIRHNIPDALRHYRIALDVDPAYLPAKKNLDRAVTVPGRRGPILLG